MLILTRKEGEKITIGDSVVLTVLGIKNGKVKIGIKASPETKVMREEVAARVRRINYLASTHGEDDLEEIKRSWDGGEFSLEGGNED